MQATTQPKRQAKHLITYVKDICQKKTDILLSQKVTKKEEEKEGG